MPMDNTVEPSVELIDWDLEQSSDIDPEWIPFSNWLRFRHDNDGLIIITNLDTGATIFTNTIAGLILKLCNGRYDIREMAHGIHGKYPDQDEMKILQDILTVIFENYRIGNVVLTKSKFL